MPQKMVYHTSSEHYPKIEVIEDGLVRYLRFGPRGGWQGALDLVRPNRPVFPYQRAFRSLVQSSVKEPSRFLSLGVGTGTALRAVQDTFPNCEMYGVEIEQAVVDIATQFFDSPSHQVVNYWIGDGVVFLCHVQLTFDMIFVDAYNANQIYSPCIDPAFPTVLHAALSDNGIAVSNIIARFPLRGRAREFVDAAQDLFHDIVILPVGNPLVEQNMLMVFSKSPFAVGPWSANVRTSPNLHFLERMTWPYRFRRR